MKKIFTILFFTIFIIISGNCLKAQSTGDYRTRYTTGGPYTFTTASNWEIFNGTSWVTASAAPKSTDGVITIRTGSNYTFSSGTVAIDQMIIENGGTLNYTGGNLSVANGTGDDLVINSGGKFVASVASPGFPVSTTFAATNSLVRVKSGGVWEVTVATGGNADDWAFEGNTRCIWEDSAYFVWNVPSNSYNATSSVTYFYTASTTDRPIFENNQNLTIGGNTPFFVNGVYKVNTGKTLTLSGTADKTFRGGVWIDGTGILLQTASTTGEIKISGTNAYLYNTGTGQLEVHDGDFEISSGASATLRSNFEINLKSGATTSEMQIDGILDFRGFYISGTLQSFEVRNNAILKTQNASGFLASTTDGCIRITAASPRKFQNTTDKIDVYFNANGNQTTSNNVLLTQTKNLYFSGTGTKTLTSLSGSVSSITLTGSLNVAGSTTILSVPSDFTVNMNTTGTNFSLLNNATMNDNCLTNLSLVNAFTTTGDFNLLGSGQLIKLNNLSVSNSSTGQYILSTSGGSSNIKIGNDFTTNFTSNSSFVDNGHTITIGGNFIASGTGASNYNLTGSIILDGAANNSTIEVRNSSSGKVVCNFNNLTINVATANPDVSIYPLAGGSYIAIKGNLTLTNLGTGKSLFTNGNHFRIRGNYTNSKGDVFLTESNSRFIFDGTGTQSITTLSDSFNKLHCDKASGVLEIKDNIGIKDSFDIKNGIVTTNSNGLKTVVIGGNGVLKETSSAYITSGAVQTTKQLPQNTNVDFGNIGLKINRKGSNNPGNVVFTRYTGESVVGIQNGYNQITGRTYDAMSMRWEIHPDNNGGLQADIELRYIDDFLNGLDENSMNIYRKGGGNVYKWVNKNGHNTTLNTILEANTDSFSEWILSGASSPLPVKLVSFTAKQINNSVLLNWATASELQNDYFSIERSVDATNWISINQTKGVGNSQTLQIYSFLDNQLPYNASTIYYRLKQVDFDGSFEYSSIQNIRLVKDIEPIAIQFIPTNSLIQVLVNQANQYTMLITDMNGKVLDEVAITNNTISYDASKLTKGVYLVQVSSGDTQFTKKIVKF